MTVPVIQYIWRGYTRELQWLEYLKSVSLEIPNVTSWSVFQNQVTIINHAHLLINIAHSLSILGKLSMNYVVFFIEFSDYSYFGCMIFLQFHVLNSFHTNFIKHSWQNDIHETFIKSFSQVLVYEFLTISWR